MEKNQAVPQPRLALVLRIFVPFACGYFLSYLYRTVNAIIAPDLVTDIRVDPAELGFLTSVYFLTFAAAQLPLGMLLDRFGPKRVNAGLLAVAGCGALVFSWSATFAGLAVGRGLIGIGVSGALMASLKAFTMWFPSNRLATVNGLLMAMGGLGALVASAPVEALLAHTNWRGVFELLAGLTFLAATGIALLVPRAPGRSGAHESASALVAGVLTVFRDRMFWRVGLVCLTAQAGFMAVQGLWVAPWLADVAGLSRPVVAQYLLWMALATTAGFAFFGDAADRFAHLGLDALQLFRIAALATTAALAVLAAGWTVVALPACILYAFGSTGLALSYSILSRRFPTHLSGRVNTAINLMVFVGAFVLQWALGFVIGMWAPAAGRYPLEAYGTAFGALLTVQAVATIPVMRRASAA